MNRRKIISLCLAAALICSLAGIGQTSASQAQATLSELIPQAFPAQGTALNKTAVRPGPAAKDSLGTLEKGAGVTVLDYAQPGGSGFFRVEWEDGDGYVDGNSLSVRFAQPFSGMATAGGYANTAKSTAQKTRAFKFAKGQNVPIYGREGKWWVSVYGGAQSEPAYLPLNKVSAIPQMREVYAEPGVYASESVKVIKGNALVSAAGVTLSNMVIEGNLYIAGAVNGGNVTLNDVYVTGGTFVIGGAQVENRMGKLAGMGKPADVASKLFRENYPKANAEKLSGDIDALIRRATAAAYSD